MGRKKSRSTATHAAKRSRKQPDHSVLVDFLPCVARWFRKTFEKPSPAQVLAWPAIRRGESTLLLAPTGSGKTLAAFLCAIDDLYRKAERGDLFDGVHVLYISPLKALGNDIHKNLVEPLAGIRDQADGELPEIRIAVRTGDTPQSDRARMIRRPPHILITTPESLYLLLGSKRMAPNLRTISTVIVDEVHAVCDNKRGVHLAVSLERLADRVDGSLQRVGCSATLSPLEDIAAFLVGCGANGRARPCTIVNAGIRKDLDVRVMAPLPDFLEASNAALWSSAYELLLKEISSHTTTLIFCNSRYKAERTALRLGELSDGSVRIGVHHGSVSKEMRLEAEDDLKSGRVDALVATASLELGIDIGSVDLVYQLESPRSVATGLQRIGRAGHLLDVTSKGRILVFERDELLEAAAICRAMTAGEVDEVQIPRLCLDVLAQQVVGAVASRDWDADELFGLVRQAYPYTQLPREHFDSVLAMLSGEHGFEMARPPRELLLWDRASGRLSATRSSAHVSAMCVGTIPDTSQYDVVISTSSKRVGTVQSEFVDDCLRIGDVFVLGSSSWKVVGVRRNRLLVEEAPGSTPTVPWWHGPVEARTAEVGAKVGALRRGIDSRRDDPGLSDWLQREYHLCPYSAQALVQYVQEQRAAADLVPDHERLLVETWRDELGRSNIILHCPYGQRINRTWGVALATAAREKLHQRWSVTASNDLLVLTSAEEETHRGSPTDALALLMTVTPRTLPELVAKSAHSAASSSSAFRDAAACSFQILRGWQGRRVPFWLLNYRAQELHQAAHDCEQYPVVAEVLRRYLNDSLEVPGLGRLLGRVESGEVGLVFQDVEFPSPFGHSLLVRDLYRGDHRMGRDRRAHLLRLHRQVLQEVLSAEQMAQLLDPRAIERLEAQRLHRSETTQARSSDELARVIRDLGDVPATMEALSEMADGDAAEMLAPLLQERRVVAVEVPDCEQEPVRLVAADLWRQYHDAFAPGGKRRRLSVLMPRIEDGAIVDFEVASARTSIPARWRRKHDRAEARAAVIERYLKCRGPVTVYEIVNHTGWPIHAVEDILQGLVDAGTVARGVYTNGKPQPQWVNKANLEEIHRLTLGYLKRELAACEPYEVVDFLTRWQHVHPATRLHGPDGLSEVIRQLQGFEVVQGALESEVLAGRVADYRPEMLERLIASGEVCWRRVSTKRIRRGALTLCFRKDMEWIANGSPLQFDGQKEADADIPDVIKAVRDHFREHGTAFFDDVLTATGLDEGAVMRAVWYLAWCGELTCDTYECVRHADFQATLSACYDLDSTPRKILSGRITQDRVIRHMRRRKLDPRLGRWSATERLVPSEEPLPKGIIVRRWAEQLLRRWGVVSKDIVASEVAAPPWSALVRELKRLELLGKVSRGYFIKSHPGVQYGLADAIELLRDCRARRGDGEQLGYLADEPLFCMSNRDPANLYTTSVDIITERGDRFRPTQRRGNFVARVVVQAGQVLLYRGSQQLVTLTRRQLVRCIEQLRHGPAGRPVRTRVAAWNGYPIDVSPVAGVLWELGFRFDKRGTMSWPPSGRSYARPRVADQEVFLPYYSEPPPVEFGPEWTVERAAEPLRPALKKLLEVLVPELDREGWVLQWHVDGPVARYRDSARLGLHVAKGFVRVHVGTRTFRDEAGKAHRLAPWQAHRAMRVVRPDDVNQEFITELRRLLRAAEEITDRFLASRPSKKEDVAMPQNVVKMNRAPVLTLWAAVVAERLGYEPETALTLGKCVAGLNAQSKGRMLGIFGPPKAPHRGGPPKKTGLGEDFWIDLCGRGVPVKNTEDGVRAVVKDKPIDPAKVTTYLKGKFGEDLPSVRAAMEELAAAFEPKELEEEAYGLYERFRPEIAPGRRGWGQKGDLNLDLIRSLGRKN